MHNGENKSVNRPIQGRKPGRIYGQPVGFWITPVRDIVAIILGLNLITSPLIRYDWAYLATSIWADLS